MYTGVAVGRVCVPADRLTDRYQEILGLLRNRGEGLQDNLTVLRVDPDESSRVVSPQVEPQKVVPLEDIRKQPASLLLVRNRGALLSVSLFLGEFGR